MDQGNIRLVIVSALLLLTPTFRAPAAVRLERVASGFVRPLFVTAPPGDTNRLFVVEQRIGTTTTGRIRIIDLSNRSVLSNNFLNVTGVTTASEQGLLGLAFHPGYATNGYFYVNYTTTGGGAAGQTEIARYQASGDAATSNVANPASKTVLLRFNQPENNHNGGWIGFGLEGYLYIASGDGGGGDDRHGTPGNGQSLTTLLGKILRIDVDGVAPYIPNGNPFQAPNRPEIWAFGLRNPWRCSIDRETGDLWIGDVGQSAREEIDFNPAGLGGLNFGWRPREGKIQNPAYPNEQPVSPATNPIFDYDNDTFGRSVTGGYVYRGKAIPELQGKYIFADFGSARFWVTTITGTNYVTDQRTTEINPTLNRPVQAPSSFGEDAEGEIYVCDYSETNGEVYKIVPVGPAPVRISAPQLDPASNLFSFSFPAAAGFTFTVESAAPVTQTAWQTVTNLGPFATATNASITSAIDSTEKYFRVRAATP